jgi:uncharacterized membrane protein (DUF4010 family)
MLAVPLLALAAVSGAVAYWRAKAGTHSKAAGEPANPLQIWTALTFAVLFVAMSMLTTFVQQHLGHAGVLALAGIVGVTDIDPFVLNLAQGGGAGVGLPTAAMAIVIATSSNNILKAIYTMAFSRQRESWISAALLTTIALLGIVLAFTVR